MFVDIGFHFNWKFGSHIGLLHKSTLINDTLFENAEPGDKIKIPFQGYNGNGQIMLGDDVARTKWFTGEMDSFIGTVQKVLVKKKLNGSREFYVQSKYKARIPVTRTYYPNNRVYVRQFLARLEEGQIIDCEVIKISKRKDLFVLKLLIDPKTT